ncbi:hypothetical protein DVH05_022760 [Phytophthora capsici]|nr:hypothetical protein DVH05_022760 [Phytophthora capsici]
MFTDELLLPLLPTKLLPGTPELVLLHAIVLPRITAVLPSYLLTSELLLVTTTLLLIMELVPEFQSVLLKLLLPLPTQTTTESQLPWNTM